jgi:hypothetical protein
LGVKVLGPPLASIVCQHVRLIPILDLTNPNPERQPPLYMIRLENVARLGGYMDLSALGVSAWFPKKAQRLVPNPVMDVDSGVWAMMEDREPRSERVWRVSPHTSLMLSIFGVCIYTVGFVYSSVVVYNLLFYN